MIQNLPTPEDYQIVAWECLIQAYKSIVQVDSLELSPSVDRDELWVYNRTVLHTAVVLVHQGVESALKSGVAVKSPLLLLEQKPGEWKTLPESSDVEFADLYTISGNDLLRTYFATAQDTAAIHPDFVQHFEDVRLLRNKIVHGLGATDLTPEVVLRLILKTFTTLYGKGSFWTALQDKFYNHPAQEEGELTFVFSEYEQYQHLAYLELFLGKGELNKHFDQDFKSRRYHCPDCTGSGGVLVPKDGEPELYPNFKYSFLHPNTPESTHIKCAVCQGEFEVERTDCNQAECPGNVIFIDDEDADAHEDNDEPLPKICLTCNEYQ